jgi:hypothetical protein
MSTYEELLKVSREFRDFASDLLTSDRTTFQSALNFFKSFCDSNKIINEILKEIKDNDTNTAEWYNKAVDSGNGTLPQNRLDAMTVIYDLLWEEGAYNRLLNIGHAVMYDRNFSEQIRKVNNSYTNLLIRYIIRQLEYKIELVKPQSSQSVQNIHNNFYAPTNVANQSSNFTQNLEYKHEDLSNMLAELRSLIQQSDLSTEEKDDAFESVEMIEEEAAKDNPKPSRIIKFLELMPNIDKAIDVIEKIRNYNYF